jgi:RNA-directed DNA polymerase
MGIIEKIIEVFPLSPKEARILLVTAPRRYKEHFIEKRNGRGQRLIAQPTAEIKVLQRWAVETFFPELPVHTAAKGYRPRLSIKHHAAPHASKKYLLKLDFKDFFPSIKAVDFLRHLKRHSKLDLEDRRLLAKLLFRSNKRTKALELSIGAPSSPAVSNTIMYEFDTRLTEYCSTIGATYTRYADDLAISTNRPGVLDGARDFVVELCRALKYPKVGLNDSKTVFTSKQHRRQLTGLILNNEGSISLGREKKRSIRAMAHHYLHAELSAEELARLRGLLAYSRSIDPEFVKSIQRMIGDAAFYRLTTG